MTSRKSKKADGEWILNLQEMWEHIPRCDNCGLSLRELTDSTPKEQIWDEMVAHAEGKCKSR